MINFYGVVEDRHDPLKIGRVRVRIHGYHTHDKQMISTPDLPWCQVILPTTSTGHSGFGTQHGLTEGTNVIGFFRDKAMQDPVITGVVAGISPDYSREDDKQKYRPKTSEGFNDPRLLSKSDYKDTPDGENPKHSPQRGFGLETSLEEAPKLPFDIKIDYKGKGTTFKHTSIYQKDLPHYPLERGESDLGKYHTGEKPKYNIREIPLDNFKDIDVKREPKYPYNKTLFTESGHLLEIDDTLDHERIAVQHRSGTFHEIHHDGSEVTRIVNDKYTVVCKDDEVYVGGKVNIKVLGDVDLTVVDGNVTSVLEKGNLKADINKGTTDVTSQGKITITGKNKTEIISDTTITGTLTVTEGTELKSTLDVSGAQTNDDKITASKEITAKTEAGKSVKLTDHIHLVGGSAAPSTGKPKV